MNKLNLKEIEERFTATSNGYSSNPGVYYESSKDVPELLIALRETREALIEVLMHPSAPVDHAWQVLNKII